MKKMLTSLAFGLSLLFNQAVYAKNAIKPAVFFIPADYPYKLTLARQLVQLDGSAVALAENDLGFMLLMKGNKPQTSKGDNYVREYLAKNSPLEAIIHIYAQELTVQELMGAIEFYKSPVGQSLAKKTSIITQKYAEQRTDVLMRAFEYAQNKLKQKKQSK